MGLLNKKENNSQTLKWIYKRTKKFLPSVLLLSVISALDALTFVALALISKNVLDVATGSGTGSITGHGMLLFGVIFAQIVLTAAQSLLNSYTNARLTISMRNYLFSLVCRKKYSYISAYHSGDLLNRFTSDTDVIVNSVVSIIPNISSMAAKIIGGISALIVLDARIAFIILVLGISVPALGRMINRKYKALHKKSQQTEGRTRSFLQECFENIVVMKTFVSEAPFTKKLNQLMKENYRIKMKRTGVSVATHISLYSFFTVGYYTILIWGAGMISSGFITYGTLMAFLQLVSQLRAPLQNVSGIMPQYYSALASAERLMEIEKGQDDMAPVSADKL